MGVLLERCIPRRFGSRHGGQLGVGHGLAFSGGNLYVSEWATRGCRSTRPPDAPRAVRPKGSGNGKSNVPWGSPRTRGRGDLYVTEIGSDRVQEFSAAGAFIATFGSGGSGDGQFSGARGVAVGPSGTVYVADTGNERCEEWVLP